MVNTSNKKIQDLAPKSQTESGAIKVHESVVSSIVRKAVLGIKGVLRFAGNSLVDNIAEFVGSKTILDRAISIEMGENSVSVEVQIILQYGVFIPEVAEEVQKVIRTQVQDMTGFPVETVNVVIMDIEEVESAENEEVSES